jgi:hypothetical protein
VSRVKNFSEYLKGISKNKKINSGDSFKIQGYDVTRLASDLIDFFSKNGIDFGDKVPYISFLKKSEAENPPVFKETGNFSPVTNEINIFTSGRSAKDCLRSLAHELIHADQSINKGIDTNPAVNGISGKGKKAEKIEADAYKRGNLLFRKWEEKIKNNLGYLEF